MTSPFTEDGVLPITVQLHYDGVWNDLGCDDVNADDDIVITRGRSDYATEVDPMKCTLRINNTDGRFSPRNPLSPLYGKIGRNTPIRVRVPSTNAGLRLPGAAGSYARSPTAFPTLNTADLDIRVLVKPDTWRPSKSSVLAAKWNLGTQQSWILKLHRTGSLVLTWSTDGANSLSTFLTSQVVPVNAGKLAVRATFDSVSGDIKFWTGPTIAGPWTQLGSTETTVQKPIFASTARLTVGAIHNGDIGYTDSQMWPGTVQALELRNGINGTVVANPDFSIPEPGTTIFSDTAGVPWSIDASAVVMDPGIRFWGNVKAWPSRWDSPDYVSVPLEAHGTLRRLGQGAASLRSAMFRGMTGGNFPTPKAYWPCEDGTHSTFIAPAQATDLPMSYGTGTKLAEYGDFTASDDLPTIGAGYLFGGVKPYTATNYLRAMALVHVPDTGVTANARLMRLTTTGTAPDWELEVSPEGNLRLIAYEPIKGGRNEIMNSGYYNYEINGDQIACGIYLTQSGADVVWQFFAYYVGGLTVATSGTLTGRTIGIATSVTMGGSGDLGDTAAGHVLVLDTNQFWDMTTFVKAWSGETAAARVTRLCAEESVPLRIIGDPATTERMGGQGVKTFIDLGQQCAGTELGILSESLATGDGLVFRTRASMYNQAAALALDYTHLLDPFEPTDDDQLVANEVTVTREGGSAALAVLESGPMSVESPPDGIGRYTDTVTVNVEDDDQLGDQAGWRLNLGTVDEDRYPAIHVALHADPDLAEDIMGLQLGDRVTIDNLPAWMPPGQVEQLLDGYTETLNTLTWDWVANCSPASPWTVAVSDDDTLGRADTEGSYLVQAVTVAATSMDVATTSGPVWTTDPTVVPFDLLLGGEVVTVSQISSAMKDTFTRTVSNGLGTSDTGQAWTVTGTASDYSTDGTGGKLSLGSRNVARTAVAAVSAADVAQVVSVTPPAAATGGGIFGWLAARYVDANNYYMARCEFKSTGQCGPALYKVVGGVTTFLGGVEIGAYSASQQFRLRFEVIGSRLRAKMWAAAGAEPGGWHADLTDTSLTAAGATVLGAILESTNTNTLPVVVRFDDYEITNPQRFTVTRSVNGVAKAQAAGTDVRLAHPAILAL